jgi:hypothetical protein
MNPAVNNKIPPTNRYIPGMDWFLCCNRSNKDLFEDVLGLLISAFGGGEAGETFLLFGAFFSFLFEKSTFCIYWVNSLLPCIGIPL